MPGCFVELVDDCVCWNLTCFAVTEVQQFSAWLSKQHGGSPFHFHFSKVTPGLVLKPTWGKNSVSVK